VAAPTAPSGSDPAGADGHGARVGHDGGVTQTSGAAAPDPTAAIGRRVAAAAIDLGILWGFSAAFWLLASRRAPSPIADRFGACVGQSFCTELGDRYVAGWPMVLLVVVWVAYLVGVFVVERGTTGRTVGTMLTGLVVVGGDGQPLGPGRALLRSVAGVVDYLPCCLPIVGAVTMATSTGHRRVGDLAAESYVVTAEHLGRPIELPGDVEQPPEPEPPSRIPDRPPVPSGGAPPVADRATASAPTAPGRVPHAPPAPPAGPVWDPHRRAYLQWDRDRNRWLQYDQDRGVWLSFDGATGHWGPLDR